ncbi:unnamed protein product, partial [Laminaria digitata]
AAAAETLPLPPPPPPPSGAPPAGAEAVKCRNDHDGGCACDSTHGSGDNDDGDGEAEATADREKWTTTVVVIHNLVDEEDVEESDDHAEIVRDLREMAGTFGVVQDVQVPRAAQLTGGAAIVAKVAFLTREEAERARQGFHGRVVGGKTLEVEIEARAAAAERCPRSAAARGNEGFGGIGTPTARERSPRSAAAARGKQGCAGEIDTPMPPEEAHLEQERGRTQKAAVLEARVSVAVAEMRGPLAQLIEGSEHIAVPLAQVREGSEHNAVVKKELLGEPMTRLRNGSNGVTVKDEIGEHRSARPPLWRVVVSNLVDEEDDLDDDDEYAEICADAGKMMGGYGRLVALDIPRVPEEEGGGGVERGKIVATFSSLEEAEAFVAGTRGRRVGGKDLDAKLLGPQQALTTRLGGKFRENCDLLRPTASPGSRPEEGWRGHGGSTQTIMGVQKPCASDSEGTGAVVSATNWRVDQLAGGGERVEGDSSAVGAPGGDEAAAVAAVAAVTARFWRVVVTNLIEEEDLEDDDDYDEVRADVTAMASVYGKIVELHVPRQTGAAGVARAAGAAGAEPEPGEAVVAFRSKEEARACARGLSGRAIGGKRLEAQVLGPTPQQRKRDLEAGGRYFDGRKRPVKEELPPSRLARDQSGARSSVRAGRDVRGQMPACRRLDDGADDMRGRGGRREEEISTPTGGGGGAAAMGAGSHGKPTAAAQSSLFATTSSTAGGKWRIPDKYKEAVALPKPPGANDRSPRVYVDQSPDKQVDHLVREILQILFKFQERARLSDPAKHMARRRLVMGLKEVLRALKAKK